MRLIFTFLVFIFSFSQISQAQEEQVVSVARVVDGDTFDLKDGRRIRLLGIDAPELNQKGGKEAKRLLALAIAERQVSLFRVDDAAWNRFSALVVWNGIDINGLLLRQGYAWQDLRFHQQESWASMVEAARAERRGIWREQAVPPWDWRARKQRSIWIPSGTLLELKQ